MDLTVRVGATARLECAATGHPAPQIAWQKDGGTDFPAARERRMHVMPSDAVFFIVKVKTEDIGVYSCTAQNTAGAISANATLTVLGKTCIRSYKQLQYKTKHLAILVIICSYGLTFAGYLQLISFLYILLSSTLPQRRANASLSF